MDHQRGMGNRGHDMVTVAVDKDKSSQYALKWAAGHLLGKGRSVTLLHVKKKTSSSSDIGKPYKSHADYQAKEVFLPFRCFCTRNDIQANEVICEDTDVVRGICEYVKANFIDNLVLGAPSRNAFVRNFKTTDVPTSVAKMAPEFCTVHIISKSKITHRRSATISIPNLSLKAQPQNQLTPQPPPMLPSNIRGATTDRLDRPAPRNMSEDMEIKSPFTRGNRPGNRSYGELGLPDTDISFVSNGRSSSEKPFSSLPDDMGMIPSRQSKGSDIENRISFRSPLPAGPRSSDSNNSYGGFSGNSQDSSGTSSSVNMEEVEAEMRRLKQELKQTMDMYSTACREALTAKQKAMELHRWKMDEQRRLEEARQAEEAAVAAAEREKQKCKVAIEAAEAAQRIAEMEAKKRISAERMALKEAEEKKKALDTLACNDIRYRKYTIDEIEVATEYFSESRRIGEGGYGPVYKCYLDHTPVAVKVLRPDAAQGRSQFQQEVEVLSSMRHPNMVLLLGACPEYGCLVYEYMANGSLEDRLLRRGNTPVLSWQLRFRIASEIGTALLFLHQSKPEPLVHRDLKPGNILLDSNYVSKISDVGLARLVPPSVANAVTQYRMTSTAGTFCYIDPEYQQTGMLGIKSDIYSLGVMLLQIVTSKPPMGLTHHVQRAIEQGTFAEMLDPAVTDWPVEAAMHFAKIALKCAEMRRKDRPDLGTVVLAELNKLRALAEDSMPSPMGVGPSGVSP